MLSTPNCPSGYVVDKMFALGRDCEVIMFLKSHSTYADAYYCVWSEKWTSVEMHPSLHLGCMA